MSTKTLQGRNEAATHPAGKIEGYILQQRHGHAEQPFGAQKQIGSQPVETITRMAIFSRYEIAKDRHSRAQCLQEPPSSIQIEARKNQRHDDGCDKQIDIGFPRNRTHPDDRYVIFMQIGTGDQRNNSQNVEEQTQRKTALFGCRASASRLRPAGRRTCWRSSKAVRELK